jgi:hypothetical protein
MIYLQPQKFKIQNDLFIEAGGYVLIWADDANTGNHANFKLSADGESLGLFDPSVQLIDTLTYGLQQTDVSMGRFPNGTNNWFKFTHLLHLVLQILNLEFLILLPVPSISTQSGFYSSSISVSASHNICRMLLYDLHQMATVPNLSSDIYSIPLQIRFNISS